MECYDALILDLDGTLWDASAVSAAGWRQALSEFPGLEVDVFPEQIQSVSGQPFEQCVIQLLGDAAGDMDISVLARALEESERRSFDRLQGTLYSGVSSGLAELSEHFRLFLVSNCQSWYLDAFWRQFGLAEYFEYGTCYGNTCQPKKQMLENIVSAYGLTKAIYIGDTESDASSARGAGVAFGHAAYGFGQASNPDASFLSFQDLLQWAAPRRTAAAVQISQKSRNPPVPNLIDKAKNFATEAHAAIDHKRKYTGEPYIVHPAAVADLVKSVPHDQAMVCAAWLHDVVEDTPVTHDEVRASFGEDIANLVEELTDISTPDDGNRQARKRIDLGHTRTASARAKTVKLADIIDNVSTICRYDPAFAKIFIAEKQRLLDVLGEGDATLQARARKLIQEYRRL